MDKQRAREHRDERLTIYFSEKELDTIYSHVSHLPIQQSISEFVRRSTLEKIING